MRRMENREIGEKESLQKKIRECFENEERARSMMEQAMMELEIAELKYERALKKN